MHVQASTASDRPPEAHSAFRASAFACVLVVFAVTLLAVFSMASASAQPASPAAKVTLSLDDVEPQWDGLQAKQRFEILEQLLRQAQFDFADRLLSRPNKLVSGDAAIHRFYIGMVRKGQGRQQDAIVIFRDVLAQNPSFTRVRLELAHALYAQEDDEAARHNFELVLGGLGSNPGLSQAVQSYIAAIDSRKRWDVTTFISVAPSTNLNQGSNKSTITLVDGNGNPIKFELSKENQKKSGVGLIGGAQASYRQPITDRVDLLAAGGGTYKSYRDHGFDAGLLNASVGPRYRFDWGNVSLLAIAERSLAAGENQARSWGGLISTSARLTARDTINAELTCSRRSFNNNWKGTDLSYQDGHACSIAGRIDHAVSSMAFMRVLGLVGRERTGATHLDNDYWTAGAGVHNELPFGVSLYLQGAFTKRGFDGVYPSTTSVRHDQRWDLTSNLTKRDWVLFGFAPQLQYSFTHNNSNVGIFQYDAHGVNLTLTKRY